MCLKNSTNDVVYLLTVAKIAVCVIVLSKKDHVWSYDFVTDKIDGKGQFRMLVVIDGFTRLHLSES